MAVGGYSRYIPLISLAGDLIILSLFFIVGYVVLYLHEFPDERAILFFIYLFVVWTALYYGFGGNDIIRHTHKWKIVTTYIQIIVFFFFFFLMYFQLNTRFSYYPRDTIKFLFPLFFLALILWKFTLYFLLLQYRRRGYNIRRVLMIGESTSMQQLIQFLENDRWHGYHMLGQVIIRKENGRRPLGKFEDLPRLLPAMEVDEIFVAIDDLEDNERKKLANWLDEYPAIVHFVPDLWGFNFQRIGLNKLGNTSVLNVVAGPLSLWYNQVLKRTFDLVLSIIIITLVLSWLIPILWLFDRITGGYGLFFMQERTSVLYQTFTIYKFRTMVPNPEADKKQAVEDDERITKLGKFLRKTCIDELPQFINVFLGDMSVVGPRPHMIRHTQAYRKVVRKFMLRHTVRPGVTGLAQVEGYRGEIRSKEEIKKRVEHDVAYIQNWSLWLDIKIIARTVWLVVRSL